MLGTDCIFFSLRRKSNVQGKGIPVSTLKAYREIHKYIASLIRDFGARRRFKPRPLYSRENISLVSTENLARWAPEPISTVAKKKITFCHQSNHKYALIQSASCALCRVGYRGLLSTTQYSFLLYSRS